MAGDVKPQPGAKFDPGKSYLVKGDLLNRLLATALPVSAGNGLKEYQSAKGKIISLAREAQVIPFETDLIASGTVYSATVTEGLIIENDATALVAEDAIRYHRATNHRDANNALVKFALTEGEGVYISVAETANGQIDTTTPITLSVKPVTTKSLNTIPGVQAGVAHYLIAELKNVGGQIKLVPVCGGSHISHDSGLNADYQVIECGGGSESQKARLRYCRGRLAGIDEDPETIPLSPNLMQVETVDCNHTHTP
jgi:hypothetical protein